MMVEDEFGAVTVFKNLLKIHDDEIEFLGVAKTVTEGVKRIQEWQPDLVMMDISLPDGTGFDVLDIIGEPSFETIFLTAHAEYAIQALRKKAFDYLLKPIQSKELHQALMKVKLKIEKKKNDQHSKKIALSTREGMLFIRTEDIMWLKADGNYTEIYLYDGKQHLVSKVLKSFEKVLGDNFVRIHKSFIANLDYIQQFNRSEYILVMEGGQNIPISERKKDELLNRITKVV